MKRTVTSIILGAAVILPAIANFVIETTDGKRHISKTPNFEAPNKIDDINIENIVRITHNPLASEEENPTFNDNNLNRLAVLDMNQRNQENESGSEHSRNVYSAEYMAMLAGMPWFTTSNLQDAMDKASMILLSSRVKLTSFSVDELSEIEKWVADGGVIVAPAIECSNRGSLYDIFGLTSRTTAKKYTRLSWVDEDREELKYFDTPEEKSVVTTSLQTTAYETSTGETLATFDDGTVAAVKNKHGKGIAYTVGIRWRDMIQRFHINKDGSIQRLSSNAFEPSGDVYSLFLRSVYNANNQVSVWKYTIPDGQPSLLIPTHDCDSRTAYDSMYFVSDYEKSLGLRAHYFLTVHYFRDSPYLSAFYNDETIAKAKKLLDAGHTVGSHSICHFPDFSKTELFPMDIVTEEEYAARATHKTDVTEGGSTWAEIVMSKNIIERDLGNNVRSFRSGHLCVNKNMPEAKVIGNYKFTSCYSASDLLSNFPYYLRLQNDWPGDLTDVLSMPLHISDVFKNDNMNETNWESKIDVWVPVYEKLRDNYGACILLIHPNRKWKMQAQKLFIERLGLTPGELCNFEEYGEFWVNRAKFDFSYDYNADTEALIIKTTKAELQANPRLGLMIESTAPVSNATVIDETGTVHPTKIKTAGNDKYIILL